MCPFIAVSTAVAVALGSMVEHEIDGQFVR
jgi:hypothetical protein